MSTKNEQLEWRRAKVVELKGRSMNHSEIARELQVTRSCIVSDVQYLRSQAKESIKEYATEYLPEQYQVCLTELDTIIKRAFEILETSEDNREKLQAMELFKDTHMVKLELLSNATTIDSALHYIRSKQQEQHLSLDSASDDKQYFRPCFDESICYLYSWGPYALIVLEPILKLLFQPLDFDCILDCGLHGYSICILLFSLQLNF